jgi:chloramphenicol-sensitive protein RarD
MNKGMLYAAGAYTIWGLLPLYWRGLHDVPAGEILAHRMVWSLVVVFGLLAVQRHWRWLPGALRHGRVVLAFLASAVLLTLNWFVYIWGVNHGHVVETSLGYFINPLVNVLLGIVLLKERLRVGQGIAIAVALLGVVYLTVVYGSFPWIALSLAFSFGGYGLIRKLAPLPSLEGLTLETMLLFVPALAYLLFLQLEGIASFGTAGSIPALLMVGSGVVTATPLLLFASGARRLSMTTLGLLQYIAPTIQFLIGVWVFDEPLNQSRLIGFGMIWLALVLYTAENIVRVQRVSRLRTASSDSAT